ASPPNAAWRAPARKKRCAPSSRSTPTSVPEARRCGVLGLLPLPSGERVGVRGQVTIDSPGPPSPDLLRCARKSTSPRRGEVTRCTAVHQREMEPMPRNIHLVGSVPMADAEQVFREVSAALGSRVKRLPDGETGERSDWITWLEPV